MSELRDVTSALRALGNRMSSIEDCLLILLRNSEQQADWRHEQRNAAQREELRRAAQARALKQVEEFQSALWDYLARLDERLKNLVIARHDDVKALSERIKGLEPEEEVTKA